MPNDDFIMICPYYHKTIGNSVFCSGLSACEEFPAEEKFCKQVFADRKIRNDCIKRYCASFNYRFCRIAQINDAVEKNK